MPHQCHEGVSVRRTYGRCGRHCFRDAPEPLTRFSNVYRKKLSLCFPTRTRPQSPTVSNLTQPTTHAQDPAPTSKTHLRWTMGYEPHRAHPRQTNAHAKMGLPRVVPLARQTKHQCVQAAKLALPRTVIRRHARQVCCSVFMLHLSVCFPTPSPNPCVTVSENGKS